MELDTSLNSLTLVTGFFDLPSREKNTERKQVTEYLKYGELLFKMDKYIIFYIDEKYTNYIWLRRKEYNLLDKTLIIPLNLEEMPYYSFLERVKAINEKHPMVNGDPKKDTSLYIILNWSKLTMLMKAMRSNPFNTTHFGWIDFGIGHIASSKYFTKDGLFSPTPDKVKIAMMRYFSKEDIKNRNYVYTVRMGLLPGGFFTGSIKNMTTFCDTGDYIITKVMKKGYAPIDEQIFVLISVKKPEIMEYYYSDYHMMLDNYKSIHGDIGNINSTMTLCRNKKAFSTIVDIGKNAVKSYQNGELEISAYEFHFILDEYYVGAFYHYSPDLGPCTEVAKFYSELILKDPEFKKVFLANEKHVRSNFSFLDTKVLLDTYE